jgi:hypothetical protein
MFCNLINSSSHSFISFIPVFHCCSVEPFCLPNLPLFSCFLKFHQYHFTIYFYHFLAWNEGYCGGHQISECWGLVSFVTIRRWYPMASPIQPINQSQSMPSFISIPNVIPDTNVSALQCTVVSSTRLLVQSSEKQNARCKFKSIKIQQC